MIAAFAVAGALAGVVWERWWAPSIGVVVDGRLVMDGAGLRAEFDAVATYVVGAAALGLVLGTVCTVLCQRDEILTLAAVVIGAGLSGWLMLRVGQSLGPPDPVASAASAEDWTELPSSLKVPAVGLLISPLAAVTAAVVVLFGSVGRKGRRGGRHRDLSA